MSDQPSLPGIVAAEPPEEPPAEGLAWFVTPDGNRVQGRAACHVRGSDLLPCFALSSLLGWFSFNARTRLYVGMILRRACEGKRDALVIEHGARAADLGYCPCCGTQIRTSFADEASS